MRLEIEVPDLSPVEWAWAARWARTQPYATNQTFAAASIVDAVLAARGAAPVDPEVPAAMSDYICGFGHRKHIAGPLDQWGSVGGLCGAPGGGVLDQSLPVCQRCVAKASRAAAVPAEEAT